MLVSDIPEEISSTGLGAAFNLLISASTPAQFNNLCSNCEMMSVALPRRLCNSITALFSALSTVLDNPKICAISCTVIIFNDMAIINNTKPVEAKVKKLLKVKSESSAFMINLNYLGFF